MTQGPSDRFALRGTPDRPGVSGGDKPAVVREVDASALRQVFVAAGSNVEPEKHLCRALLALEAAFAPLRVSPAYRNRAVGFDGADFINLVVGFATALPVEAVRRQLQAIEASCDRPPDAPKWAPRTMDLDILLYGQLVSNEPGLLLPRPDLLRRAYMLKPLADIAPDFTHPALQRSMRDLWQTFDAGGHELIEVTIPRCDRRQSPESGR
jgi:2-amino-4-hydroxy-6-hydroxymethyldihydropteridine diphosphokinase